MRLDAAQFDASHGAAAQNQEVWIGYREEESGALLIVAPALGAAYLVAAARRPIAMDDVVRAVARELEKDGPFDDARPSSASSMRLCRPVREEPRRVRERSLHTIEAETNRSPSLAGARG